MPGLDNLVLSIKLYLAGSMLRGQDRQSPDIKPSLETIRRALQGIFFAFSVMWKYGQVLNLGCRITE